MRFRRCSYWATAAVAVTSLVLLFSRSFRNPIEDGPEGEVAAGHRRRGNFARPGTKGKLNSVVAERLPYKNSIVVELAANSGVARRQENASDAEQARKAVIVEQIRNFIDREPRKNATRPANNRGPDAFDAVLEACKSTTQIVILSLVDDSYVDLAQNLFETSFQRFNLTNYIFASAGSDDVCRRLSRLGARCIETTRYFGEAVPSDYHTPDFARKTRRKIELALLVLRKNLSVFVVDLDIVFLRDPTPFLVDRCIADCDVVAQMDKPKKIVNTGFYLVRPTPGALAAFADALAIASKKMTKRDLRDDQDILNGIFAVAAKGSPRERRRRFKVEYLKSELFPSGHEYFLDGDVMFKGDNRCDKCIIVHNNWIVGHATKVYRFKEAGFWSVDYDGYYSDPNRKYLAFDNSVDFGRNLTILRETKALENALTIATLLDRVVVLPRFHCYGCKGHPACRRSGAGCSMNYLFSMSAFDDQFGGRYREHVFLDHPKVPENVKSSMSPTIRIDPDTSGFNGVMSDVKDSTASRENEEKIFAPKNANVGPTVDEIIDWFGKRSPMSRHSVLRFSSLYDDAVATSTNVGNGLQIKVRDIRQKLAKGLKIDYFVGYDTTAPKDKTLKKKSKH